MALGRRHRPQHAHAANLDALFLVPSAAITLQTAAGLEPTGAGSVCYRAAEGAAFAQTQTDVVALLDADRGGPDVQTTHRRVRLHLADRHPTTPTDMPALCTDLHAVNTALEEQGFGPGLLCSLVAVRRRRRAPLGLVYLYKQGTFYPFAPTGPQQRDNLLEIQVRDTLARRAADRAGAPRWMAVWGAPGPVTPARMWDDSRA